MNIEHMIQLGKQKDFDKLEEIREQLYQELINKISDPEQKRKIEGLHFKAKNIRYRYKNPLMAAIKANELMLQSLGELNKTLGGLKHIK